MDNHDSSDGQCVTCCWSIIVKMYTRCDWNTNCKWLPPNGIATMRGETFKSFGSMELSAVPCGLFNDVFSNSGSINDKLNME